MNSLTPARRSASLPKIAVVIPVFGHSLLVVEAVNSVLRQDFSESFVLVLVNDGCRLRETHTVCAALAALDPERISYIRRPNGGLSAARNSGIRFALNRWESVQAIYLLDADNRLLTAALRRSYARLRSTPGASWVYPSIDMFGMAGHYDYDGPYALLAHTQDNLCEAGSLIARTVFEAGVWFDESMRQGYEDWDFWLQAAGRGLRGVNEPWMGFQYRRRAESMLADAGRCHVQLIAHLKERHRQIFSPKGAARLEAEMAPRYVILIADTGKVVLTTDPVEPGETITLDALDRQFWQSHAAPHSAHFPPFIVTANSQILRHLGGAGMLRWAFWKMEQNVIDANVAALKLTQKTGERGIEIRETNGNVSAPGLGACEMMMLTTQLFLACIEDKDLGWLASLIGAEPRPEVAMTEIVIAEPQRLPPGPGGAFGLLSLADLLGRSKYREAASAGWDWRCSELRPRRDQYLSVRGAIGRNAACYPYATKGTFNIGFLVTIAAFGGVEKVAYNVARELKSQGWGVHLFVIGKARLELPPEFATLFDTLNLLVDSAAGHWSTARNFHGVTMPSWKHDENDGAALGLLYWLDVVINCHSVGGYALMGQLRRFGITTLNHLHVMDQTKLRMPTGNPVVTLAYEHAFDKIVCCSAKLARWMHASGVPEEKLLVVRNGPGFMISSADAAAAAAQRDFTASRLRALFFGRLDRQKGLDRLAEIVRLTQSEPWQVEWRIVGGSVLDGGEEDLRSLAGVIEPPVVGERALLSRLGWAHVLALPSYWEGMPLGVIEAMQCGAVVVATDTGAMREIITDGVDGFLVPNDADAAQSCCRVISMLAGNRPLLRAASQAAFAVSRHYAWGQAVAPLIAYLEERQAQRG